MSAGVRDDGGPAFPVIIQESRGPTGEQYQQMHVQDGMSLRDWFAGQAMNAHIGIAEEFNDANRLSGSPTRITEIDIAKYCYDQADAMLAARKDGQS